jgi:hypothetical protein
MSRRIVSLFCLLKSIPPVCALFERTREISRVFFFEEKASSREKSGVRERKFERVLLRARGLATAV